MSPSKKSQHRPEESLTGEHAGEKIAEKFVPEFPPTEDEDEAPLDAAGMDISPDDAEQIQEEEKHAGFQSDDEEWGDELTGERPDNGYLPGQRMAEHGIDSENFPKP